MPSILPAPGAPNVLYLVDLSGYIFRAYHAITTSLTSPSGETTHAVLGTITMLQRLFQERKPAVLAVAMDSPVPTFRTEIDPRYKAHRPPAPPDLHQQMVRCRQIVEAYRIPVLQRDGFEADDLIATAVRSVRAKNWKAVIVSADKDLMQLIGNDVLLWDTMRNKVYGPDEVKEKFGVPPSQIRDFLSLTGDPSDNIPGVPSIGPKTAAELLSAHGSFESIYANLESVSRKKIKESLQTHAQEAKLSQRLVTLRDDLDLEGCLGGWEKSEPDIPQLRSIFKELGFSRLLSDLDKLAGPQPASNPSHAIADSTHARPSPDGASTLKPPQFSWDIILSESDLLEFVTRAHDCNYLAVDTETTSVDATRAVLIGISLSIDPKAAIYIPLSHHYLGAPKQLSLDIVQKHLRPLLASDTPKKVGHHIKYDELVLRRHGLPLGAIGCDTMIASYLLDPEAAHGLKEVAARELGIAMTTYEEVTEKQRGKQLSFEQVPLDTAAAYAAADAAISLTLTEHLLPRIESEGLLQLMRDVELPLARLLVDIELTGVLVDTAELQRIGTLVDAKLSELEIHAKQIANREFNINAPRQLETLFFDDFKLPVIKRTKTARSTDAEVLEALSEHHPLPRVILEHRQLAKLKSTYIDTLPTLVNPETGRIHTRFNQTNAATGRLSSSDPNLQNIPIRTDVGRAIRGAFIAPEGYVLVSADYSQIELRVLAHLSSDPVLLEAFRTREDIHTRTAMEILGVQEPEVTSDMRRMAKTINFGILYGMGDSALGKRLGIPRAQAKTFIEAYFQRYAGVKEYLERSLHEAQSTGSVTTLLGRRRFLPELSSANRALRLQAERIAQNTPIQGASADILKLAMIRLCNPVVPGARMILTVHDELVFEVPQAAKEQAGKRIRETMEAVLPLRVPLVVEVGYGRTWAEAHS